MVSGLEVLLFCLVLRFRDRLFSVSSDSDESEYDESLLSTSKIERMHFAYFSNKLSIVIL